MPYIQTVADNKLQDKQLNWLHIFMQWIVVGTLAIMMRAKYHMQVKGRENRPKGFQSYVVASNHSSSLDPPIISVAMKWQPISYMSKIELYRSPAWTFFHRAMACVAVNREKVDVSTIKSAIKVLKSNRWALGIFPEGTRNAQGALGETKKGVAFIAKAGGASVLPIGIHRTGPKMKDIYVRIGALIPPEDDIDTFNTRIQSAIAQLVEQTKADAQET